MAFQHMAQRTGLLDIRSLASMIIQAERFGTGLSQALRIYADNLELLETRFRDDYTDPDPLLAETLIMFAALAEASGDFARAIRLRAQAAAWAPGSVWSRQA